jgi:hypothetical protein
VESNKPAATEAVLLSALGKFFDLVLNYPAINRYASCPPQIMNEYSPTNTWCVHRRLSDVMELLSSKQPKCPQLYIYSSADRVIPARSVVIHGGAAEGRAPYEGLQLCNVTSCGPLPDQSGALHL